MPWFLAAKAFLGGIPRWVWIALAAVAALTAGIVWHQHKAKDAIQAAVKREDAVWAQRLAEVTKHAVALREQAERASQAISENVRKQNDEANRTIAADAAAVRLRGPGAASCRSSNYSGVSISPGEHVASGRATDAAVAPMPPAEGFDLIGLPFTGAVSFATDHDTDRAEVLSWRGWYAQQSAAWAKMREQK